MNDKEYEKRYAICLKCDLCYIAGSGNFMFCNLKYGNMTTIPDDCKHRFEYCMLEDMDDEDLLSEEEEAVLLHEKDVMNR